MTGKPTGDKDAAILLVDDEPYILAALKRTLRSTHWEIHTAQSGEKGIETLERIGVQVVISDYRMAGMDGVTFLRRV